jgi:hypothetical protein
MKTVWLQMERERAWKKDEHKTIGLRSNWFLLRL